MSNAQCPGININVTILCGCHVVVVVCLFVYVGVHLSSGPSAGGSLPRVDGAHRDLQQQPRCVSTVWSH